MSVDELEPVERGFLDHLIVSDRLSVPRCDARRATGASA